MGVAADQRAGETVDHVGKLEAPLLPRDLAVIDDLEEQIAQLAGQVGEIGALDRVGDLIGFFNRVGNNACVGLLDVPGAAILRIAQARHEVEQVGQCVHR
jgi:hypothetical protein